MLKPDQSFWGLQSPGQECVKIMGVPPMGNPWVAPRVGLVSPGQHMKPPNCFLKQEKEEGRKQEREESKPVNGSVSPGRTGGTGGPSAPH